MQTRKLPSQQCVTLCLPCASFLPSGHVHEVALRTSIFSETPCAFTIAYRTRHVPRRSIYIYIYKYEYVYALTVFILCVWLGFVRFRYCVCVCVCLYLSFNTFCALWSLPQALYFAVTHAYSISLDMHTIENAWISYLFKLVALCCMLAQTNR